MMTFASFQPASSQEIKRTYPYLFREDTLYFYIVKNDNIAGIYGIIDRKIGCAEVFLTVFEQYRFKVINKSTIDLIVNTPFNFGFTQVWSWTRHRSWIKVLQRLKDIDQIAPPSWDLKDATKNWFKREKR